MSDRLVTPEARNSVLAALAGLSSVRTIDPMEPSFPPEPVRTPFKSSAVNKVCKQHHVKTLARVAFPANIKVDSSDYYSRRSFWNWSSTMVKGNLMLKPINRAKYEIPQGENFVVPDTITLPMDNDNMVIPKYKPSDSFNTYDLSLWKQVLHWYLTFGGIETVGERGNRKPLIREGVVRDPEDELLFRECYRACGSTFYGNPAWESQITRMSQLSAVNLVTLDIYKRGYDISSLCNLLDEYLPLPQIDPDVDKLVLMPSEYFFLGVDPETDDPITFDALPPIKAKALAGLPFDQFKGKEQMRWSALAIADSFYKDVAGMVRENQLEWYKLISKYPFAVMNYMFPKADRYEWNDNCRNIVSTAEWIHFLAGKISMPKSFPGHINCGNSDTPSMSGFSMLKGGCNRLMKKILNGPPVQYYVYADNVYMLNNGSWYSLDLIKGEGQATRSVAQTVGFYFLSRWYQVNIPATSSEPNKTVMYHNRTWAIIAMFLIPYFFVDASVVFSNVRIDWPGQGSGNTWTFYINHVTSVMLVDKLKKANNPLPGSIEYEQVLRANGFSVKVERVVPNIKESLLALRRGHTHADIGKVNFPSVDMDILGYSVTSIRPSLNSDEEEFVPVLDYSSRLYKSAMIPKPVKLAMNNPSHKANAAVLQVAYENMRLQALFLVGAWGKRVLHKAISSRLSTTSATFHRLIEDLQIPTYVGATTFDLELPMDFEGVLSLKSVASKAPYQLLEEIFKNVITAPPERAKFLSMKGEVTNTVGTIIVKKPLVQNCVPQSWADDDERTIELTTALVRPEFYNTWDAFINDVVTVKRLNNVNFDPLNVPDRLKTHDPYGAYGAVYDKRKLISPGDMFMTPSQGSGMLSHASEFGLIQDPKNVRTVKRREKRKKKTESQVRQQPRGAFVPGWAIPKATKGKHHQRRGDKKASQFAFQTELDDVRGYDSE